MGWVSVPDPEDYQNFEQGWNRGALAWETGTGPSALIHGLEASLKLLLETGEGRITDHLENLTDYLCERLEGRDYEIVSSRTASEKSHTLCIRHKGDLSSMHLYGSFEGPWNHHRSAGDSCECPLTCTTRLRTWTT